MEPGDFLPDCLDDWLDTVVAIATQDDLYITEIEPADCRVHFEGLATVWTDEECTVEFSVPVGVSSDEAEAPRRDVRSLELTPGRRYRILRERP